MKRALLIILVLAAIAGVTSLYVINQKTQRIKAQNEALAAKAAQAAQAAKTATPAPAAAKVPAPAPENIAEFKARMGSKMRMEGTSSIHDWHAEGSIISGSLKIDKAALAQPKPGPVYAEVKALIPVSSLKSSSGPPMDAVMLGPKGFDTEKGADYQRINYNLDALVIRKAPVNPGDPIECDSQGDLIIHAVTNKIDIPVTIAKDAEGGLLIKGQKKLAMSSFGIPPVKVTVVTEIITGDEVNVTFEWKLAPVVK